MKAMSDISERLRDANADWPQGWQIAQEAADFIDKQKAEIERLRGAIEYAIFYLEEFVESDAADKLRLVLKETE
jgi:hypothetical protein